MLQSENQRKRWMHLHSCQFPNGRNRYQNQPENIQIELQRPAQINIAAGDDAAATNYETDLYSRDEMVTDPATTHARCCHC
jgi:hypothetical protein